MDAGRGTSKKYSSSSVSYARYEPWIGRDLGDLLAQRSTQVGFVATVICHQMQSISVFDNHQSHTSVDCLTIRFDGVLMAEVTEKNYTELGKGEWE